MTVTDVLALHYDLARRPISIDPFDPVDPTHETGDPCPA